jgi:hypothetical protein
MKEDILEQVIDDYLHSLGYFTRHNLKFHPDPDDPAYSASRDSVPSDIDVLGINPHCKGYDRVWVVSCKSWQSGFRIQSQLVDLKENRIRSGRESWKSFRELVAPKWSKAFCEAIFRETGSRRFTYITAVTRLVGNKSDWELHRPFRLSLQNNPLRLISLSEIVSEMLPNITQTPSSSDLGRTLQLLKAAGVLGNSLSK